MKDIKCKLCGDVVHQQWKDEEVNDLCRDCETEPDWDHECEVCGMSPILPVTGMCGPCTFGEADTILGNW